MREHVQFVPLNELTTIRVACDQCGAILELPLDRTYRFDEMSCPVCIKMFYPVPSSPDKPKHPFRDFMSAIQTLKAHAGNCRIEFPLKIDADSGTEAKPL